MFCPSATIQIVPTARSRLRSSTRAAKPAKFDFVGITTFTLLDIPIYMTTSGDTLEPERRIELLTYALRVRSGCKLVESDGDTSATTKGFTNIFGTRWSRTATSGLTTELTTFVIGCQFATCTRRQLLCTSPPESNCQNSLSRHPVGEYLHGGLVTAC